jgi:hypothetical protein
MAKLKSENTTQIIPYIFYRDVPAALDWLAKRLALLRRCGRGSPLAECMGR